MPIHTWSKKSTSICNHQCSFSQLHQLTCMQNGPWKHISVFYIQERKGFPSIKLAKHHTTWDFPQKWVFECCPFIAARDIYILTYRKIMPNLFPCPKEIKSNNKSIGYFLLTKSRLHILMLFSNCLKKITIQRILVKTMMLLKNQLIIRTHWVWELQTYGCKLEDNIVRVQVLQPEAGKDKSWGLEKKHASMLLDNRC